MPSKASRSWITGVAVFSLAAFMLGGMLPGDGRDAVKAWFSLGDIESIAHFLFSAWLVFLGCLLVGRHWVVPGAVIILGALIEMIQVWIPGRSASLSDFLIDVAGVALGCILYVLLRRFLRTDQSVIR